MTGLRYHCGMNLPSEQQQVLDRALHFHNSGKVGEAEKLYRSLLEEHPQQADALHYLGVIGLQFGRFDEAVSLIQRAVDARPGYVDAFINLGYGLTALGRYQEAVEQLERALATCPASAAVVAQIRHSLADTLLKMGRPNDALREIRKAVSEGAPSIAMQMSMANILLAAGQVDDAIQCVDEVLKAQPEMAQVRSNLARILHQSGRLAEAIGHYEELLVQEPGNVEGHFRLGVVFQDLGEKDKALAAFRNAVRLDSSHTRAWHGISAVSKNAFDEQEVTALLELQQAAGTSSDDRMRLAFALGRHFENAARHDEAAAQYLMANQLKSAELEYEPDNHLRAMENIRTRVDRAFLDKWSGAGVPDRTPIFIVGMPRSGTTLIEQILASHSEVFGAGELPFLVNSIVDTFPISNGIDYTDSFDAASNSSFETVAGQYLDSLPNVDADRITDKLPHNFLNVGMIRILFPNATLIHCHRDPRDTCFSIYKHLFGSDSHAYAYDLRHLARYYNGYKTLMDHWEDVMPGEIHNVEYESIIDNQEQATRELLDACGLEWDPGCLEFHSYERPIATLSASQVRQPVYRGSIGAWKPYEKMLEPLLEILG